MNAAVAQKTQETLGRVIKKPPLTEKLLSKPPFRYLQDIFSEVIHTTGFMKGLYSEVEMKSDNVKDKEAKIAFLQKAIDVVMLASGEPLSAKPARIVAGHEPEKTNELLQAIGRCCLNKLSSDEAVKRVLAGDRPDPKSKPKSQDKENRESRDRNQAGEVRSAVSDCRKERKELKERSTSRDGKDSDLRRLTRDREDRRAEKDRPRDPDRSKDRDRDYNRTKDRHRMKDHDRSKDRGRERNQTKDRDRTRHKSKDRDGDHNRSKNHDHSKDRVHGRKEEENDSSARERDKRQDKEKESSRRRDGDREVERERMEDCPRGSEENTKELDQGTERGRKASPARLPRPTSAKGQRQRPKPGAQGELSRVKSLAAHGGVTDVNYIWSSTRRIPRPSSARPAPPRMRRQESYTEPLPLERLSSGKSSAVVIVEGAGLSDQEGDEQFVVEERAGPLLETVSVRDCGLVKKILETKKDYEKVPLLPLQNEKRPLSEAHRKERDLVSRETERLAASVQTVCRSTLPLGRIIDYLQEDVDSMQVELQVWQLENQEHAQALLQEQRVTESMVEPLMTELAQLEQLIRDQQEKIYTTKCNIVRNEVKIQKMVLGTNSSSHT
ncbi:TRAF3-interacting protein 1-like isoform X3 [Arapaima gigas]